MHFVGFRVLNILMLVKYEGPKPFNVNVQLMLVVFPTVTTCLYVLVNSLCIVFKCRTLVYTFKKDYFLIFFFSHPHTDRRKLLVYNCVNGSS